MPNQVAVPGFPGKRVPIFPEEGGFTSSMSSVESDNPFTPGHWSQNLFIRLMLGVVVTAAVTLLLIRSAELVLFWFMPVDQLWKSAGGFFLWQGLEMVGVFFGAMFCVAGRSEMLTMGFLLGLIVGFITLAVVPTNLPIPQSLYFVMPAWFTVSSSIGAWVGEKLWHPQYRKSKRANSSSKLTQEDNDLSIAQLFRQAILGMIFAHIKWLRIILAVLIILPTLIYLHDFMNWFIIKVGLLSWVTEVGLQKSWLELMIKMLVVILFGAMAGAGTNHGVAHGFWTGVICGVLDLLWRVLVPSETALPVDEIMWEVGWVFVLSIVAGGFGALVVPPIMYLAKRRQPVSLR